MTVNIGRTILNSQHIADGVQTVASTLNQTFKDKDVVFITLVPGGIFFAADLFRALNFDFSIDYVACHHTPGSSQNHSPIIYQNDIDLSGKHLVLVDDAIETGGTMKRVAQYLSNTQAVESVSIATLFVKPSRVNIPYTQYFAYEMPNDDMLVGYGLGWDNKYQNLPEIKQLVLK